MLGLKLFLLKRNVFVLLTLALVLLFMFEQDVDDEDAVVLVSAVPIGWLNNEAVVVVETFRLKTGDLSLNLSDRSAL